MQTPVQAQHAEARTVVQGGVLKRPAICDLHILHVDLDRFSRFRLLEEFHLPRFPLAGPPQAGQSHVTEHALNRSHGQPDPMGALQPEARPRGPVAELLARMADQLQGCGRYPARPVPRIGRQQPLNACGPPPLPPPPDCPGTDSIVPASGGRPVCPRILEHNQPMPHVRYCGRTFTSLSLIIGPPLSGTSSSGCPSKQRRSILSRYFTLKGGLDCPAVAGARSQLMTGPGGDQRYGTRGSLGASHPAVGGRRPRPGLITFVPIGFTPKTSEYAVG